MKKPLKIKLVRIILNQTGATLITTMLAASIIVLALSGSFASYSFLQSAMNTGKIANLVVDLEDSLIQAFHSKLNFPDPIPFVNPAGVVVNPNSNDSPNEALRNGTLNDLDLITDFGTVNVRISPIAAPITSSFWVTEAKAIVSAPSANTPVRVDIRLVRDTVDTVSRYSFSYEIKTEPMSNSKVEFVTVGSLASFDQQIAPGLYRAEAQKTNCDPTNQVFSTGFNRDTGEAFCAEKPTVTTSTCPQGHLPKGIRFVDYVSGSSQSGTLQVSCTSSPMRVVECPKNYALNSFNPSLTDPENVSSANAGTCILQYNPVSPISGTYPSSPSSKFMSKVEGTFCPPSFKADDLDCKLAPDYNKNNDYSYGAGKCADTKYKDCFRTITATEKINNSSEVNKWTLCYNNYISNPPTPYVTLETACGLKPDAYIYKELCREEEVSTYCSGYPDTKSKCDCGIMPAGSSCYRDVSTWSGGKAYADNPYTTYPSATAVKSATGRKLSCSFRDTSKICKAPNTDFYGSTWGKKDPKWYGGVYVGGGACKLDTSLAAGNNLPTVEVVNAKVGK